MKKVTAKPTQDSFYFGDTEIAFSNKSDKELKHVYRLFKAFNRSSLLELGISVTKLVFKLHLPVKTLVKKTVYKQFCGGEDLKECETVIANLADAGVKTILEYSLEAKEDETAYDNTLREMLKEIDFAVGKIHVKAISCKVTALGRFDLFARKQAGRILDNNEMQEFERVRDRMDQISKAAKEADVGVYFDAEESWIQEPLDELVNGLMEKYNKDGATVYNTFQFYRRDRLEYLKRSLDIAKSAGYILGVKLVRGAYMEKERNRAEALNYPPAIYAEKPSVDNAYNEAVDFCIEHIDDVAFCIATHNEESCRLALEKFLTKDIHKSHPHIFFSQLYGMGDHITYNLAQAGFEATKLIPYGPVQEAIPYLIRRAEENSSISGQMGRELSLLKREMARRKLL